MLSHIRIKADGFKKGAEHGDPTELRELYAMMTTKSLPNEAASSAAVRRNPFLSFQSEDQGSSDSEEVGQDEPTCVYKQVHIGEAIMMGVMLMSDGWKRCADRYEIGEDGFIVCHWDCGERLHTEIPNKQLSGDRKFICKPDPPARQPALLKKPSAATREVSKKPSAATSEKQEGSSFAGIHSYGRALPDKNIYIYIYIYVYIYIYICIGLGRAMPD